MPPPSAVASMSTTTLPAGPLLPLPSMSLLHPSRLAHADPPTLPLLLSPSFPPIPAKLVAKARGRSFVALKEFLGDNIALVQRLDEVQTQSQWPTRPASPRMRDISSPIQWAFCLLSYAAVLCDNQEIRDILSHGRIVLTLAQRHGGLGWLEYDRAFRQQATADSSIRWNTLNPSLMAATVLSAPPSLSFQPCPHCHEADHRGPDCALASVDPYTEFKPITPRPKPYTRPPPADAASIEICRRFNCGICTDPSRCKYRHICAIPTCLKPGHSALACPLRQDLSRPRPGPPPTR